MKNVIAIPTDNPEPRILSLSSDLALHTNELHSYLGGDRFAALSSITGEKASEKSFHEIVCQSLENLKIDSSRELDWMMIYVVVGDAPIYQDLQSKLINILNEIDIEAVYKNNPSTARMVFQVAAIQLHYSGNKELLSYFEEGFLRLIKYESIESIEKSTSENDETKKQLFGKDSIYAALLLSHEPDSPQKTSSNFSKLLSQLIYFNPKFADLYAYFSLKAVFELPLSQLHGMWKMLLAVRASSKNEL